MKVNIFLVDLDNNCNTFVKKNENHQVLQSSSKSQVDSRWVSFGLVRHNYHKPQGLMNLDAFITSIKIN